MILADGDGKPAEVRRRIQETLHGAAIYSDTRILTIVVDPELETVLGITRGEARQGRLAQLLAQVDLPGRAVGNSDLRQLLEALGLMS